MSNKKFTTLYLATMDRDYLLNRYDFYAEQAKKRIFSQFSDIEGAAHQHSDEWYNKAGSFFDPENDDPADYAEQAYEEGINFYVDLYEMRNTVYLAILSSLYHQWEKDLRGWLVKEIKMWTKNDVIYERLRALPLTKLFDLIESLGIPLAGNPMHDKLLVMSDVVNTFKHGEGKSFKNLKGVNPEYFRNDDLHEHCWREEHIRPEDLNLSEVQFDEFAESIKSFWLSIPVSTCSDQCVDGLPSWFEKLLE